MYCSVLSPTFPHSGRSGVNQLIMRHFPPPPTPQVRFNNNDSAIASGSHSGDILIHNVIKGHVNAKLQPNNGALHGTRPAAVLSLSFSPHNKNRLASSRCVNRFIRLCCCCALLCCAVLCIDNIEVTFSSSSSSSSSLPPPLLFASSSDDGSVHLYDPIKGERERERERERELSMVFSGAFEKLFNIPPVCTHSVHTQYTLCTSLR